MNMAQEVLPSEYDIIILGTGATECILAAAFARAGNKVLHLDSHDYYSGDWATFNFKALREWIQKYNQPVLLPVNEVSPNSLLEDGEQAIPLDINGTNIHDVKEQIFVKEKLEPENESPANETAEVGTTTENNHPQSTNPESTSPEDTNPECRGHAISEDTVLSTGISEKRHSDEIQSKDENQEVEKNDKKISNDDDDDKQQTLDLRSKNQSALVLDGNEKKVTSWTLATLEKQWRHFNIDLMPKVLFCRGSMVDLLITSDVAKYCEFRTVTRVLTVIDDKLQQVPCSRSDVFSSKQVTVIEKRMLMKFLTFAMEYENHPDEYKDHEEGTYLDFLKSKNLSPNVLHYILHAIAMVTEDTPTIEGLKNTKRFLQSLGRYGNTAFLWPLYGTSDLLQCFCRMCAVFGGIYCLSMTAQSVIVDKENKVQGVISTQGQRLKTKWLVMQSSHASKQLLSRPSQRKLSRAILLVDDTIFSDKDEHITLLSLPPPTGGTSPITVLELSSLSMACPSGLYVIHLTCETVVNPESDLTPAIQRLYHWKDGAGDDAKPNVLWSLFFTVTDSSKNMTSDLPSNLFIVSGPDGGLDFEHSIHEAKTLFQSLCPDEEFLPKAPNPEDIVYDDGENAAGKMSGFNSNSQSEENLNNAENEAREAKQSMEQKPGSV